MNKDSKDGLEIVRKKEGKDYDEYWARVWLVQKKTDELDEDKEAR